MNEETIFAAALELESAERANYLAKACGGNSTLRKRLEGLIAASERAGNFMARPAIASAEPANAATEIVDGASTPHDVTVTRNGSTPLSEEQSEAVSFLSPSTRPDSLGRIGHYEVLQILGKGGFGIVFRAFDDVLQRVVAVKVMAPQLATTSPARKRFLREARTSAQVRHENVVQVYEVVELPLPYLAMEFIPGETLQERLNRTGPLDVPETLRIGRQIAEGLAAAHATDVIHRDIKPSNVLIEGGPQQRVKITDFGLARAADDASISQSGIIAGTPMYMAPEQALGHKLDQRADLFSLGSVLYQMVAGRAPFRANSTVAVLKRVAEDTPRSIREIIPETPQWLCDIIAKLHAKNPDARYQSAREVADVLADCETQLKTHGEMRNFARIPGGGKSPVKSKYRRLAMGLCGVAALFGAAMLFGEPAYRYAVNRAAIDVVPESGLTSISIHRDGQAVTDWYDAKTPTITLPPGKYKLEPRFAPGRTVERWELRTRSTFSSRTEWQGARAPEFEVARGEKVTIRAMMRDEPAPSPIPPTGSDGFVPLFNGKDLTGWKPNANWTVIEGGVLSSLASGQGWAPGHKPGLMSERDDFENFHLRVEARINDRGNSGIWFRLPGTEYQPDFYEAEINSTSAVGSRTGTLAHPGPDKADKAPPPAPNEWFTMEVIAIGKELIVQVNGRVTAHWVDPAWTYKKGAFELQQHDENTIVQFRKIEIKELPAN